MGFGWAGPGYQSSLTATEINYESIETVQVSGARKDVQLRPDLYRQVQDLWSQIDPSYKSLRDSYRLAVGNEGAQLPSEVSAWPSQAEPLQGREAMLKMNSNVSSVRAVKVNGGKIRFTTVAYRNRGNFAADDTSIKAWFTDPDDDDRQLAKYGRVRSIFEHSLFPGKASRFFVECDWLDPLDATNGMAQGLRNPRSVMNQTSRIACLSDCAPYNIALLSQRPQDPGCTRFAILDRGNTCAVMVAEDD